MPMPTLPAACGPRPARRSRSCRIIPERYSYSGSHSATTVSVTHSRRTWQSHAGTPEQNRLDKTWPRPVASAPDHQHRAGSREQREPADRQAILAAHTGDSSSHALVVVQDQRQVYGLGRPHAPDGCPVNAGVGVYHPGSSVGPGRPVVRKIRHRTIP
jgi:hypothetical protein